MKSESFPEALSPDAIYHSDGRVTILNSTPDLLSQNLAREDSSGDTSLLLKYGSAIVMATGAFSAFGTGHTYAGALFLSVGVGSMMASVHKQHRA